MVAVTFCEHHNRVLQQATLRANTLSGCSYGRGPIPGVQVVKWRTRIMRCLDLPTRARVFPRHPNLVIVDRPLVVGRGFLNRQQIVQRLAVTRPPAVWEIPWNRNPHIFTLS